MNTYPQLFRGLLIFIAVSLLCRMDALAQKVELVVPTGHSTSMRAAAFSPDGTLMASSGHDGTLILWDAQTGRQIKTFKVNKKWVIPSVAFSPDGSLLAAALEDEVVVINTVRTEITKIFEVKYTNHAVAFSPDGQYLLSAGGLGVVSVWHTSDLRLIRQFNPFKDIYKYNATLNDLQISPDGKQFATCSKDAGLLVFDMPKSDAEWSEIEQHRQVSDLLAAKISYTPDGKYIITTTEAKTLACYEPGKNKVVAQTEKQPYELMTRYFANTGKDDFIYEFYGPEAKIRKRSLPELKDLGPATATISKYGDLFYDPYTKRLFGSEVSLVELDPTSYQPNKLKFEAKTITTQSIAISPNGNLLALNIGDIVIWDMQQNRIVKRFKYPQRFLNSRDEMRFDKTGKYLFVVEGSALVQWEVATWTIKRVYKHESIIMSFSLSPDGKYVATVDNQTVGRVNLWSALTGLIVASNKRTQGYEDVDFSSDSKFLAVTGGLTPLVYYSLPALTALYTGSEFSEGDHVRFSPDGDYIYNFRRATIFSTNPRTKITGVHCEIPDSLRTTFPHQQLYMSPDGKHVGEYLDDMVLRLAAIRAADRRLLNDPNDFIQTVSYTGAGKYYASATNSGQIMIRNVKDEVICMLYLFNNALDWAVVTPDGRFDATVRAQNDLYYHKGTAILPLASLFEQYYTPRLLPRLLNGEVLAPVDINLNDIKARPLVKINYTEATRNLEVTEDVPIYQNTTGFAEITVTAKAPDDAVDEFRLFHNGKIVTLTTRNLIVADDTKTEDTKKYRVALQPGTNYLRALALNTQRTESMPAEIAVNYNQGAAPVDNGKRDNPAEAGVLAKIEKTAKLHLLVVGINKYRNPGMALNYAIADATAFKNETEKGIQTIIKEYKTYFVADDQADQAGILNAFDEVKKNARAEDIFVFYYAGHGKISEKYKEFYLVPTDVTDLEHVDEALLKNGISSKLLQQYAIDIAAQKQLFILDACQSAGAFTKLLSNDGQQQKSLAVVARSTGTHWLAASGSQQLANEFVELGHGAFTYTLLKGMSGGASSNKMITVNGLKSFLTNQVPDLTKKYNGAPQYPASYGFGSDFPIEILK